MHHLWAVSEKSERKLFRCLNLCEHSVFPCRINDLESGVERLRNHQEILKRKLKKQSEKKLKLEVGTTL